MARTFAIGDIHGELEHLERLLTKLPPLVEGDTLVFMGDYIDRGLKSAEVVAKVRELERTLPAKVVCLRGNHEDGWLRVIDEGWVEFVIPRGNGCVEALRSFRGEALEQGHEDPSTEELIGMMKGAFFPADVVAWMRSLPYFYENEHAIFVHAGLVAKEGRFLHPSETEPKLPLLWTRSRAFFADYRGKLVVVGHTATSTLPPELSSYTPEDPTDFWAGPNVVAIDTGCGKEGGFLTGIELPTKLVYESRD
jgi:serine/threonine protein phosphatase 1